MSVGANNMANKVFVLNNSVDSVNSFRWVHVESYRRRSLAPIRYVAQAARSICVTYLIE
jgi:hypothetical protein